MKHKFRFEVSHWPSIDENVNLKIKKIQKSFQLTNEVILGNLIGFCCWKACYWLMITTNVQVVFIGNTFSLSKLAIRLIKTGMSLELDSRLRQCTRRHCAAQRHTYRKSLTQKSIGLTKSNLFEMEKLFQLITCLYCHNFNWSFNQLKSKIN